MITLTAQMRIQGENPLPFTLGGSELGGGALFGETIDVEAVFDRRNLLSLESEIRDRSDIKLPSWGIFSNGGNLSFKDTNSRFLGYANAGLLKSGIKVEIFLNDTISKRKEIVGTYYTADWEYDNDSRSVSVSLKDNLENLQEVLFEGFNETYETNNNKNGKRISLKQVFEPVLNKIKSIGFYVDEKSQAILLEKLENLYIDFPHLKEGNLWSQIEKFCKILNMRVYKKNDNSVIFDF